ncbi:MAG: F-box protein [Parachlamydiaceae bacterium]|nr:F-box protein [Parachlamydiaceae bacterium]
MFTTVIQNDLNYNYGLSDIPSDLLIGIFNDLKFKELCKMSCVCKSWLRMIADNATGAKLIKGACLKVESNESWLYEYIKFLKTPQIIALDVSASMSSYSYKNTSLQCSTVAFHVIYEIISKLSHSIKYGGIECIAFEGGISRKICTRKSSVIKFFKEGYTKKKYRIQRNHLWYLTDINLVFSTLHEIQKEYLGVTCQATIISDFDDSKMEIKTLMDKRPNIHIQCINVGGEKELFENILRDYSNWSIKEAYSQHNQYLRESKKILFENKQRKYVASAFGAASHSAKNRYRIRDKLAMAFTPTEVSPKKFRAKKRKLDVALHTEYEIPLQLTSVNIELQLRSVNLDNWKGMQKKRKISIL